MRLSLPILLVLALLLPQPGFSDGRRVHDLELRDLAGHMQKLSSLRGQIVVVNFWATWCGPCREELPLLARLSRQYADRKVKFLAVSIDEGKTRAQVQPYIDREHLALEVWLGGSSELLERYNMGQIVPATLILDEQGYAVARIQGEAREEDLRGRLDWLLNGRAGVAPAAVLKRY
ncbi:MAG TPA: TlpA disulfide reductase family protein [Acidisarcina sp.]|nr:TlpA disulfide reductase family protein [Acidisarcina sp.]